MRRWTPAVAVVSAALAAQSSPIVRGGDVTFVAAGDRSDPPRIVADFNGWDGGEMTPSVDGRTFTLHVTLDPEARIEYLIAYRNRFVLDPGNPLSVPAPAGPPRSELRMPQYHEPIALPFPRQRGTVEEIAFQSRSGDRRRVRVYVPPEGSQGPAKANTGPANRLRPGSGGQEAGHPVRSVLYVHDGAIFLDQLALPALLDSLIDASQIAPVIVVFIDAVDRHDDYEPGSPFRTVFTNDIVPTIERKYALADGRRGLMGLSRSTVGAIDTCVNGGIRFEECALVAPAVARQHFSAVLPAAAIATRFFIAAGTYDIPLIADARAMRHELERRKLAVQYSELPQGHNHTAFRAALPALLRAMFPVP